MSLGSLYGLPPDPVRVIRLELLHEPRRDVFLIRARAANGATGYAAIKGRAEYLYPIFNQLVAPYFVGKDARDLPELVEGVYRHRSNYKLAGIALWCCVAWAEFALLDLLGQVTGKGVTELLAGPDAPVRSHIPVYLSSLRRDTTPEQEVEWLAARLAETGATAVKVKVGGRMSGNADAAPGRSERLVGLARQTFGPEVAVYVDANGSYDAPAAIEVGRMLEAHGVGWFEEPCPFEELEQTKQVADALDLPVAGGEQDASLPRFADMARRRVVDILQPDVTYNGGFLRTREVAAYAAAAGIPVAPHSPRADAGAAYLLHFAAMTPNIAEHMELAGTKASYDYFSPAFEIREGRVAVPTGPGLGVTLDPDLLTSAVPLI